jgi:hypothetical protein
VIPEDVWFILPEKTIRGMWSVGFYPKLETAKYREYQEAWHLLRGETPGFVARRRVRRRNSSSERLQFS